MRKEIKNKVESMIRVVSNRRFRKYNRFLYTYTTYEMWENYWTERINGISDKRPVVEWTMDMNGNYEMPDFFRFDRRYRVFAITNVYKVTRK